MSALSAKWAHWADKFAALTRRERIIVAGALLFGGGFLIFNFGIEPSLLKARGASRAEMAARTELAREQAALAAALKGQSADPDIPNRNRLVQLRQELTKVSGRLAQFEAGMVPPARMQAFLEGILTKNSGIQVLGFKTLPVAQVGAAPVAEKPAAEKTPPLPAEGIYQHGIEITLAGSYTDLLNYLAELERMPQRVMWNSISLKTDKYPRNIMVLRIYTLSLDRNWLIV